MTRTTSLAATVLLAFGAGMAQATTTTIVFEDYNGGSFVAPGVGATSSLGVGAVVSAEGYAGLGPAGNTFGGNLLRNTGTGNPSQGSSITLSNLPAGGKISFEFLFAAIDSWDSGGAFGPDFFELVVDGTVVFSALVTEFAAAGGVALGSGGFGFNSGFADSAWDFTSVAALRDIAYSGTSMSFRFRTSGAGWQGGSDESWGLDNLRVLLTTPDLNVVPLPGTLPLLLAAGVPLLAWRRRARA